MVWSLLCEYKFTIYKLQLLIVINYLESYNCVWHDMLKINTVTGITYNELNIIFNSWHSLVKDGHDLCMFWMDGWTFLHSMITYNRTDLLRIRNFTGTGLYATADVSVTSLCVLNNRRTRRGCRAGRSKQRPTAVFITPPPTSTTTVHHKTQDHRPESHSNST